MEDIVVKCANCGADVPVTESLAAPIIDATKKEYEQRLAQKDKQLRSKDEEMEARRKTLEEAEAALDETISRQVRAKADEIARLEAKKARNAVQAQIEKQKEKLEEINALLESRTGELSEAKKAEADYIKAKREFEDKERNMNVRIQERVSEELQSSRQNLRHELENEMKLKLREKDLQVESMKTEIESLKRKAEQGSQQLQGDAMERELIEILAAKFPHDVFSRVPKGVSGGDCVQEVYNSRGKLCGTILWESKRTKTWSDAWIKKLKTDQQSVKADAAIIISSTLPKEIANFDQVENVWVTGWECLIPVASSLRHLLIEISTNKRIAEGQTDKAALIYQYVTGSDFRQRVQAVAETFVAMQNDLRLEQTAIKKQWSKREAQLQRMSDITMGMYGQLQGIAGKSVPELEGIGFEALESAVSAM